MKSHNTSLQPYPKTYNIQVPHEIPDCVSTEMSGLLSAQEQRIVRDLYRIAIEAYVDRKTSDGFWTGSIKHKLAGLAAEQKLLCCHSGTTGEWLYDICWVETDSEPTASKSWLGAQRLKMVCECEWAEDEDSILWDFMKLSWAQSDIRVFIYTNHMRRGAAKHPVTLCWNHCPPSHGSRFLLIGFPKRPEKGEFFRVDAWTT